MPNGEFNPLSSTARTSATPSPLASRSRLMRLALGTPAPARFITRPAIQSLRPVDPGGLGGALLSATSTSPLGSTYSQRGWSRPLAKAATRVPVAATGVAPVGQPWAGATFTVGTKVGLGAGSLGVGPVPSATDRLAWPPQATKPADTRTVRTTSRVEGKDFIRESYGGEAAFTVGWTT